MKCEHIIPLAVVLMSFLLHGCITEKDPYFEVYRWYGGDSLGKCAGPIEINNTEGKWVVLDIYAARPMPATDGVSGWHFYIIGSDGNEYAWFSTSWGCVRDFYSEPNELSAVEIGTRGNIIFVLPRNVEPERLVLEIDGTRYTDWTFDESILEEETWFAADGIAIETPTLPSSDTGQDGAGAYESCSQDVSDCDKIDDPVSKAFCYQGVAYCKRDPSICGMIESDKQTIKDHCYVAVAGATGGYTVCSMVENTTNADECYLFSAQSNADITTCDFILDRGTKDWCYGDVAEKTLNSSICESIESVGYKNACYWEVAVKKPDASLCANVVARKGYLGPETCYENVAEETNDISICNMILGSEGIYECKRGALVLMFSEYFSTLEEKNVSICATAPGAILGEDSNLHRDVCYTVLSYDLLDVTLCEYIGNSDLRDDCYYGVARYSFNATPCEMIGDQITQDECFQQLAVYQLNSTTCEQIESQDYKDLCYGELSWRSLDSALCESINDRVYEDFITRIIAEREKGWNYIIRLDPDISYCENLTNQMDKDNCYDVLVKYEPNITLCERIESQFLRDSCYGKIAIDSSNVTLCELIKSQIESDKCYGESAMNQLDINLCGSIADKIYKDAIIQRISRENDLNS
ncbi:hypothetical protein H0O02_03905 [Candidatus Micrarchaeota archaeon]|nr:hypothetical protein [Candidatus Micrarchaeota archaeon]